MKVVNYSKLFNYLFSKRIIFQWELEQGLTMMVSDDHIRQRIAEREAAITSKESRGCKRKKVSHKGDRSSTSKSNAPQTKPTSTVGFTCEQTNEIMNLVFLYQLSENLRNSTNNKVSFVLFDNLRIGGIIVVSLSSSMEKGCTKNGLKKREYLQIPIKVTASL